LADAIAIADKAAASWRKIFGAGVLAGGFIAAKATEALDWIRRHACPEGLAYWRISKALRFDPKTAETVFATLELWLADGNTHADDVRARSLSTVSAVTPNCVVALEKFNASPPARNKRRSRRSIATPLCRKGVAAQGKQTKRKGVSNSWRLALSGPAEP
jgi:hypothetical protein